jgi:hypothetical protein
LYLLQKQKKNDNVQPQEEVDNYGSSKGPIVEHQEYNAIASFTQILTAPTYAADSLLDQNLF